jgi:hypothetical protein
MKVSQTTTDLYAHTHAYAWTRARARTTRAGHAPLLLTSATNYPLPPPKTRAGWAPLPLISVTNYHPAPCPHSAHVLGHISAPFAFQKPILSWLVGKGIILPFIVTLGRIWPVVASVFEASEHICR